MGTSRPSVRVALVTSPHAGSAESGQKTSDLLRQAGVEVVREHRVDELQDREIVHGIRYGHLDAIVAAGGDGTIGAVASLAMAGRVPLGILPMGTSNDTARSLGVPLDLAHAAAAIATGVETEVDVGVVGPTEGSAGGRSPMRAIRRFFGRSQPEALFMHAATLGLNVEFARLATDADRRQRLGQLTYIASTVEALTKMQAVPVTLHLLDARMSPPDGGPPTIKANLSISLNAIQVAIINTPVFGGRLNLHVPGVGLNDRMLDFLVIEAPEPKHIGGWAETLLSAFARSGGDAAFNQAQLDADEIGPVMASLEGPVEAPVIPGVRRFQARAARIETATPVDVTLDGEICASTPLYIGIARKPLTVLLTPEAHRAIGALPAPITATASAATDGQPPMPTPADNPTETQTQA